MDIVRWLIILVLNLFSLVLVARVLASWLDPQAYNPISRLLLRVTEPVLAPIRRVLPRTGPVDLAPLILFIVLVVLSRIAWALL